MTERILLSVSQESGVDLGGGCRGCAPPPPARDDLRFSNTTGILPKKKLCGLLVLKLSKRRVHPLLKKILDPPLRCMISVLVSVSVAVI